VRKKSPREQAEKLSFRLTKEYADLVYQVAEASGLTPNQVGRMATMFMVRNRFHEYPEKFVRVEASHNKLVDAVIRLTKDFNEAVYREGE